LVSALVLASDLLVLTLAFLSAYSVRKALIPIMGGVVSPAQMQPLAIMLLIAVPTVLLFSGSYPGHGRAGFAEFRGLVLAVTLAYIMVGVANFLFGYGLLFSRLVFLLSGAVTIVLLVLSRVVVRNWGPSISWWAMPAVVVGAPNELERALVNLRASRRIGYKAAAALVLGAEPGQQRLHGVPVSRFSLKLLSSLQSRGIDLAIVASTSADLDHSSRKHIHDLTSIFARTVYVAEDPAANVVRSGEMLLLGRPTFEVQNKLLSVPRRLLKRAMDLTLCLMGLSLGIPVFALLALLVAVDSRGHVLYRQKRLGLRGKVFDLYKFRTMQVGAEEGLDALLGGHAGLRQEYQARHKMKADPRITRVGRLLRRFSIDELPQIWNVIRGEMSIVGPRPYLPSRNHPPRAAGHDGLVASHGTPSSQLWRTSANGSVVRG